MKKEIKDKENEDARRKLRELKEKYELTWPEVAKLFGRSLRAVENWASGQAKIPAPCKILILTYLNNPQIIRTQITPKK